MKKEGTTPRKEAVKRYRKKNPELTRYGLLKRRVNGFVNPKPGTVAEETLSKADLKEYHQDLLELRDSLDKRLEEVKKVMAENEMYIRK